MRDSVFGNVVFEEYTKKFLDKSNNDFFHIDDLINSSDISFYDIKKIPPKKPAPETLSMSLFMSMFEVGDADGSK